MFTTTTNVHDCAYYHDRIGADLMIIWYILLRLVDPILGVVLSGKKYPDLASFLEDISASGSNVNLCVLSLKDFIQGRSNLICR